MIAIVQRVTKASVEWGGGISKIDKGLVMFVGIGKEDNEKDIEWICNKVMNLRIFPGDGEFDRTVLEICGEILVVSEFTLMGDVRKGRRPDFSDALGFNDAKLLYESLLKFLYKFGINIKTGKFGAEMLVKIYNDGPVTFILDSSKR